MYTLGDVNKLGKRIRQLREAKNYSQEELAKYARIRPNYISFIERSQKKNLKVVTVLKICNALECSFDDLMNGRE